VRRLKPNDAYQFNPSLKIVRPGWAGNKVIRGMFANGENLYVPRLADVWKWKLSRNPQKAEKEKDDYRPRVIPAPDLCQSTADSITWLGHASFLLRLQGCTFLVDPVLFDLPLIKRRTPLPCPPESFRHIDYLLLSHGHRDHLDAKSLKLLFAQNPGLKALAPLAMGALVAKMVSGLPLQEAGWYQQFNLAPLADLELFYLPAAHWHRRGLFDMNKVLWGSFLLRTKTRSIFFAGDTALDQHFTDIRELFGPPDICILPVGAYKPPYLMQRSHLNPREAVEAFNLLAGKQFIPMHYGTFDLSDEPAGEPVRLLQEMAAAGKINGHLVLPAIGQNLLDL
jgi:L-ascorbate metabolism protein UlaG (beta-lactamase superfamily)